MKRSWQTQDITPDVEQDFTNFLGLGNIFQNIQERRESSGSGGTDNQVGNAIQPDVEFNIKAGLKEASEFAQAKSSLQSGACNVFSVQKATDTLTKCSMRAGQFKTPLGQMLESCTNGRIESKPLLNSVRWPFARKRAEELLSELNSLKRNCKPSMGGYSSIPRPSKPTGGKWPTSPPTSPRYPTSRPTSPRYPTSRPTSPRIPTTPPVSFPPRGTKPSSNDNSLINQRIDDLLTLIQSQQQVLNDTLASGIGSSSEVDSLRAEITQLQADLVAAQEMAEYSAMDDASTKQAGVATTNALIIGGGIALVAIIMLVSRRKPQPITATAPMS